MCPHEDLNTMLTVLARCLISSHWSSCWSLTTVFHVTVIGLKKKKKKKGIVSWRTRRRGFNSCCHDWGGLYHSLSQVYTITVRFLSDYIKIFKCFEAKKHHNPKHKSINKIRFLPLVPETVTAGPPRGGRGTILLSWLSAVTQTMTWTSAGYYCW